MVVRRRIPFIRRRVPFGQTFTSTRGVCPFGQTCLTGVTQITLINCPINQRLHFSGWVKMQHASHSTGCIGLHVWNTPQIFKHVRICYSHWDYRKCKSLRTSERVLNIFNVKCTVGHGKIESSVAIYCNGYCK